MVAFAGGCATIVSGTTQEVSFQSNPEDAKVSVGGRVIGKTPVTLQMKKKAGQPLIFEKEGYKTLTMQLDTRMNGWFWGNILIGGLLGSTTDGVSGAVYEYSPSQYMVSLEAADSSNLGGRVTNSRAEKAKEFIVVGYNNIIENLSKGEGPHLNSLLNLLEVPEENRAEAVKKIRALSEVYTDILEFTDQVINLYVK